MKKIIAILGLALFTTASALAQDNACKVIGSTSDIPDGKMVRVSVYAAGMGQILDSAEVKGGKFEFTIPMNELTLQYPLNLSSLKSQREWAAVEIFAEPGTTLKVTLSYDYTKCSVTGSPLNFIHNLYMEQRAEISKNIIPLREAARDTTLTEVEREAKGKEADAEYQKMVEFMQDFAYKNIDNRVGLDIIHGMAPVMDKQFVAKALSEFPAKFDNHPYVVQMRAAAETEAKTAEGKPMVDLTMDDPKGKQVTLSQFVKKNKLTLVDFWASWCGPCRAAIPGVKRIYETYKKKGFGVVGVSFDSKKEAWVKAINDLALPWPQMSDLKGWGCAASDAYNIKAIPFTLLVTNDGTIVGRNLESEEAIIAKIEEILK